MRQGVICMLIAALVLQLAGGVVAGGAEPLAMTTQETIRTVAVSGVPTALMRGARLPERMPSFHTDAACHLADSWQSWSGMVWFSSPDGEHISKPLPAGTVTEPGVYYYLGLVLEPDGLASFSDAPSVTVCGTTAAVQRLEDGRLFVCVRYGSDDGRLEGLLPETLPFRDVSRRAWYFESVAYAYRQGLMSGTGTTEFEPDTATSRAMLVQVLYRLAGQRRGRRRIFRCRRRRVVCRCRRVGGRGADRQRLRQRALRPGRPRHTRTDGGHPLSLCRVV